MFGGQGGIRKSYLKLTAIVCRDATAILFSSDATAILFSSDGKGPGNPSESCLHSKIQLHPWTEENTFYMSKVVANAPFSWGSNSCKG